MKMPAITLLLFAVGQAASGLSGHWSGFFQVSGSDGHVPQFFVLTQTGTRLTGTGGPNSSERYPIADGRIVGTHVTFDLTDAFAKFSYDLTDFGSQLNGKITIRSVNHTRTAEVTLKKSN